jgi:hypothetical protein
MLERPDPILEQQPLWARIAEFFAGPSDMRCPACGSRNVCCDNRECPMGEHSSLTGR